MGVKRETMTDSETTNWTDTHAPKTARQGPGRPRSIPPEFFETVLQLYAVGLGYRSITTHLRGLGVSTTHTAVRRMIKGEGAYAGQRAVEPQQEADLGPNNTGYLASKPRPNPTEPMSTKIARSRRCPCSYNTRRREGPG